MVIREGASLLVKHEVFPVLGTGCREEVVGGYLRETVEGVAEERLVMVQAGEFGVVNVKTQNNSSFR